MATKTDPGVTVRYIHEYPASRRLGLAAIVGFQVLTAGGRRKLARLFSAMTIGQRWVIPYGKTEVVATCCKWKTKGLRQVEFTAQRDGKQCNLPRAFRVDPIRDNAIVDQQDKLRYDAKCVAESLVDAIKCIPVLNQGDREAQLDAIKDVMTALRCIADINGKDE